MNGDPSTWLKAFDGLDLGVMAAIAVIAFILEYIKAVNAVWSILVPLVLGAAWGALQGSAMGWNELPQIVKGVMMNGAFASVTARGLNHTIASYFAPAEGTKPPAP